MLGSLSPPPHPQLPLWLWALAQHGCWEDQTPSPRRIVVPWLVRLCVTRSRGELATAEVCGGVRSRRGHSGGLRSRSCCKVQPVGLGDEDSRPPPTRRGSTTPGRRGRFLFVLVRPPRPLERPH